MKSRNVELAAALLGACVIVVACGTSEQRVLGTAEPEPLPLIASDAGAPEASTETFTSYCPSDRCPAGHTTCPNSHFLCDVNLLTDPLNCGECGNACPPSSLVEEFTCVGGRCVMVCKNQYGLDCDGVPDNGCETPPTSNDHCGVCGNACPEGIDCVDRSVFNYGCGCEPGEIYCANQFPACLRPDNDDANCGACGNACPRAGDGSETAPPNTYFGCHESQCGTLKCVTYFGDCDGVRDNGCETRLLDNDNCGGCGVQCAEGQQCALQQGIPTCMCPEGQTFCGTCSGGTCSGRCADLSSSRADCGACGSQCPLMPRAASECVYGKCVTMCLTGWGDCDGNAANACETNLASDPKNCGACGNVCDGIAGQACVDGQCMVEPCEVLQDGGGPTR